MQNVQLSTCLHVYASVGVCARACVHVLWVHSTHETFAKNLDMRVYVYAQRAKRREFHSEIWVQPKKEHAAGEKLGPIQNPGEKLGPI